VLQGVATRDLAVSSQRTRELLGWEPTGPSLVADIEGGAYADQTVRPFRRS
jgi:hypothetical protein